MSEQHHVGLDVSVKETAIRIVDPHGKVVHRSTVESHPEVIGRHPIDLGHSYASYAGIYVTEAVRRRGDLGSR